MTGPVEKRMSHLTRKLRSRGFRLTPQRLAIIRALVSTDAHPTADGLYHQLRAPFPTMSLATVYKTLETLRSLGEVLEVEFRQGSTRYDGRSATPHTHLICSSCGRIQDLSLNVLSAQRRKSILLTGHSISHYRFDVYGVCPQCQKRSRPITIKRGNRKKEEKAWQKV